MCSLNKIKNINESTKTEMIFTANVIKTNAKL